MCGIDKTYLGASQVTVVKNLLANAGDMGLIPGWGRISGEGNGNPLQYSCLENPMEKAGKLQSTGFQRVGHNWATNNFTFPFFESLWIMDRCCCCCYVTSVVSNSVRPHRRQPTRLRRPWDSPGKNTGVGCHFLLQCMKVKSESEVAQLCPTLRNPMDFSLPVSIIKGYLYFNITKFLEH